MKFSRYLLGSSCLAFFSCAFAVYDGIDPQQSEPTSEVSDANSRIDALEQAIASLQESLSKCYEILQNSIQAQNNENTTAFLQEMISEFNKRIRELQTELESLRGDVRIMKADVSKCITQAGKLARIGATHSGDDHKVSRNLTIENIQNGNLRASPVSTRCSGLPPEIIEQIKAVERLLVSGAPAEIVQEKLTQIRDEVARLEDESAKALPRTTFSGISEWFKDEIVMLYIVEQFRNGKEPQTPNSLTAIDRECIATIKDLAAKEATIAEIKKCVTINIGGQPGKTIEPPQSGPTIIELDMNSPPGNQGGDFGRFNLTSDPYGRLTHNIDVRSGEMPSVPQQMLGMLSPGLWSSDDAYQQGQRPPPPRQGGSDDAYQQGQRPPPPRQGGSDDAYQ
ncbi:MAG: hypothetical protein LBL32_02790, partial [Holosporales bacterium]|nr:hypothetical protein [Holosporales bacterium]